MVKNKIAPPFREAEFDVMYGQGISRAGELLDLAVKLDVIQKSGAWFSYNQNRLGQGRDKVKEFLKNPENAPIAAEVEEKVKANVGRLYTKTSPNASPAKPVAVPVTTPAAQPASAPAAPASSGKGRGKASLDIEAD